MRFEEGKNLLRNIVASHSLGIVLVARDGAVGNCPVERNVQNVEPIQVAVEVFENVHGEADGRPENAADRVVERGDPFVRVAVCKDKLDARVIGVGL